jgi:hypothetical protein
MEMLFHLNDPVNSFLNSWMNSRKSNSIKTCNWTLLMRFQVAAGSAAAHSCIKKGSGRHFALFHHRYPDLKNWVFLQW